MKHISPSILASDMLNLGNEIKKVENSGAKYVHIDIMDGRFVPNISFGMPIFSDIPSAALNPTTYITIHSTANHMGSLR